ncbi:MAG: TonB-dependent receptor domain-containing protein, partial [Chitinophagaceae bacterium]
MVKKVIYICSILIFISGQIHAQKINLFDSLITDLERKFSVKFFFDKSQTSGISVPTSKGTTLDEILEDVLDGTGLLFHKTSNGKVIIFRGNPLYLNLSSDFFNRLPSTSKDNLPNSYQEDVVLVKDARDEKRVFTIGKKGGSGTTALISGYIRDGRSGEPLPSTSIMIEGTSGGVSTDAYGFYSITIPKGKQVLKVTSIGMKEINRHFIVQVNVKMDIELQPEIRSLKTAVVVAQKQSNVRGQMMGVERLSIQTIKQIPAVLGESDILRALQTLPGVTSVGEGTAGYNVRGGAADQNLVLLNDMTIYNPTHLFGFFSAVDPEVIRGLELYKSGIPERLGGRISSIMEVNSKDGNAKKVTGTAGIGPLTSRFTVEGPLGSKKTTFLMGGRATYSNWFMQFLPEEYAKNSRASFKDLFLHLTHDFSDNDKLYVSGYISDDEFKLNGDSTYGYTNTNFRIKWKHNFNSKFYNVLSAGMDGYKYSLKGRNNPADAFNLQFGIKQWSAKSDFKYAPSNKQELNFGVQHMIYDLDPGSINPADEASIIKPKAVDKESATESTLYLGDQYRLSNKINFQAGIRYSYYRFLGPRTSNIYAPGLPREETNVIGSETFEKGKTVQHYQGPEIRVSFRYLITPRTSFKMSYNTMRQYIHMVTNSTAISPTDTWKLSDQFIKPQIGDQLSAGIYMQPGNKGIEISVEAYYKRIKNYLDYKSGAQLLLNKHLEEDVINTRGKAYGIEFLLKKPLGKLNGWLSYTYLRSFLQINDPLAGQTINNGKFYPSNYDKPNIASLVANYKFTQRFSFSMTMSYSTGRPITYPVGIFTLAGQQRVYFSDRNAYRIPDFFRTDFSFILENNHKVTQKFHTSWSLG